MARVVPLSQQDAPSETHPFYAAGDPGPIPATLAHVPDLMAVALPFIGRAYGPSAIDVRTKEVVILRTSHKLGCHYCTQTHSVVALNAGLAPDEVAALRGERSIDGAFSDPALLALIAWTDAVADAPRAVPERAHRLLAEHWSAAEIVELTLVAAVTVMLNRYATALDLPVAPAHVALLAEHGW